LYVVSSVAAYRADNQGAGRRRGRLMHFRHPAALRLRVRMRLSSKPCPQFHFIKHGHSSVIRNVVDSRYSRDEQLLSTITTRLKTGVHYAKRPLKLHCTRTDNVRNKLITQWADHSLQVSKASQPRPRRPKGSASRNDQWRAGSSASRKSSIQQRRVLLIVLLPSSHSCQQPWRKRHLPLVYGKLTA
jgi:hypothetical protein